MRAGTERGNAGFSMVELLVTIVLAGIVFAAMIPLFVSAQQKQGSDISRNVALQIARDKLEKLRILDYDQVSVPSLDSNGPPSDPSGLFGTQWTSTSSGAHKVYTVRYAVDPVPTGAAPGTEDHKRVKVTIEWTEKATTRKVTLQSDISRQYFGPKVDPLFSPDVDNAAPEMPAMTGGGVLRFIATVAQSDLALMPGGKVSFVLSDANGNKVASQDVPTALDPALALPPGTVGQYQWSWDSSGIATGDYLVVATATSGSGATGQPWPLSVHITSTIVAAPTNVAAAPGDTTAIVTWNVVTDAVSYQLWRGTSAGTETLYKSNLTSASYLDTGLTNGTMYYYKVKSVDSKGGVSPASNETSCTPVNSPDTTPPHGPIGAQRRRHHQREPRAQLGGLRRQPATYCPFRGRHLPGLPHDQHLVLADDAHRYGERQPAGLSAGEHLSGQRPCA